MYIEDQFGNIINLSVCACIEIQSEFDDTNNVGIYAIHFNKAIPLYTNYYIGDMMTVESGIEVTDQEIHSLLEDIQSAINTIQKRMLCQHNDSALIRSVDIFSLIHNPKFEPFFKMFKT
jgi:hypothetical protein